jgi:hypothetical protein
MRGKDKKLRRWAAPEKKEGEKKNHDCFFLVFPRRELKTAQPISGECVASPRKYLNPAFTVNRSHDTASAIVTTKPQ